ncbi:hypothetical protein J1N35_028958, partial [Gossypium stocksii]
LFSLWLSLPETGCLVVSEDGKKVRRQHPLTESDMEELQIIEGGRSFPFLPQ